MLKYFRKMKIRIAFFLLLFCVLAYQKPAMAEHGWEFSGWYGGGCFPNIEFDGKNEGRVYLVSDVTGIWKSDDRGEHWRFINRGLKNLIVSQIVVAPSDSNVLYAATKGGLFYSLNAGNSWNAADQRKGQITFSRPENYRSVAVSSEDPKTVCAGTAKGQVFCSDDYGRNWTDLDPNKKTLTDKKPITVLLFTPNSKRLLIGSNLGFMKYDFSSRIFYTYKESPKDITDMELSWDNTTVYAAAGGKLWLSYDSSKVWEMSKGQHKGNIFRIALQPSKVSDKNRVRIYAVENEGWNGRIIFSDDQGKSWDESVAEVNPDRNADPTWSWANPKGKMTSLKIDPFDAEVMFETNWWGVFRSNNNGRTWNEKIVGAPNTVGSDIAVTANGVYVATMDNGLLKSDDGGKTYRPLFPVIGFDSAKNGHVWRVAVPGDKKIIATSSPWNEKVNQVIVSEDDGEHFQLVREGLPLTRPRQNTMWAEGYPRALSVDPQNSLRVYLGIDGDDGGGLFISDNGGRSWTRSAGQPDALRIYNALSVDPTDTNRIFWGACGKGGGVYRSLDQGKSWTHVLADMSWVFDLAINSEGTIYAAGDHNGPTIFVSRNHGKSWEILKHFDGNGPAEAVTVDPNNPQRLAVNAVLWGGNAATHIYLTQDGGKSWRELKDDLPDGAGAAAMAFSPDGKFLYMTRYAGSVYRIQLD